MDYCISILRFFFCFLLMLTTLPPSLSQPPLPTPLNYSICLNPYKCGELPDLYYPFWGYYRPSYCGGGNQFELKCDEGPSMNYTTIGMGSTRFEVKDFDPKNYSLKIEPVRPEPGSSDIDVCSPEYNFNLSTGFSYYQTSLHNITLFYKCSAVDGGRNITCYDTHVYYEPVENDVRYHRLVEACGYHIQVPAEAVALPDPGEVDHDDLGKFFGESFEVKYNFFSQECVTCLKSKGACGSNESHPFTCYCPDGSNALNCSVPHQNKKHGLNWEVQVVIVIGAVSAVIAGLLIACCFTCKLSRLQENLWLTSRSNQEIEAFLKNHGVLSIKRYKLSDVKKMTNSFKVKLGQGGFGIVYKGNLLDGSNLAVKMLNPSKGNGEDFINEVASISRTSHVNVVALLGFCIEGRKKALIYEFMPNGSLDKFIYKMGHENPPSLTLSWDNLYQIAVGIARGLEYLHRGCNTRILHFDIKPHNILLDENFCPKISDFGLAKLCPRKESIISMSDARGSIGYVAPEVWNRHFGGVSHKSDVYSYGMMLLEIVGGRKNINAEASETSEIYFPDWIYTRLEHGTHLGLAGELAMEENEVIKRMTMVGLWCIQTFPKDRPTMSGVIDMLEGNINSLEMPPKPVLSSPIRSVVESSNTVN